MPSYLIKIKHINTYSIAYHIHIARQLGLFGMYVLLVSGAAFDDMAITDVDASDRIRLTLLNNKQSLTLVL